MPLPRALSIVRSPRSGLALGIAVLLSACSGDTPVSPSPLQPLAPGRYEVAFTAGSRVPGNASFCSTLSSGPSPPPDTAATFLAAGTLDAAGRLTLRPEAAFDLGWTMTVEETDAAVSGTVRGSARDMRFGATTVAVDGGSPQSAAALSGRPGGNPRTVGGTVDGRVVFSAGGTSYTCGGSEWRITRRE